MRHGRVLAAGPLLAIELLALALLPGCGSAPAPQVAIVSPVPEQPVTAGGVQQFPVPPAGRAILRQRLTSLLGNEAGAVSDAGVSNAWRTAASAARTPDDYAACVRATTPTGLHTYVLVVSGQTTGGLVSGPPAAQRCADPTRVREWVPFTEALAEPGL